MKAVTGDICKLKAKLNQYQISETGVRTLKLIVRVIMETSISQQWKKIVGKLCRKWKFKTIWTT